ncbi:hypothetical protein GCM10027610_110880 [Dactylosporangium cerinum]
MALLDDIPPKHRRLPLTFAEIEDHLDRGTILPEWHTPPAVARELARSRPPRRQRGLVVFFTGLSGSGKSTMATGVADALQESGSAPSPSSTATSCAGTCRRA